MKLEIFEPTMCCPTGICGPSVDEILVKVGENIEILKSKYEGIDIQRYQPQTHPFVFMGNMTVSSLVKENGQSVLPITVYNGKIIKQGEYPTLEEMEEAVRGE
jgi:hypothetical protein